MKIIIVSGFLGAGKTSFIQEMIKKTGKRFAIVENEFGTLGFDGELLKNQNEDLKVWELTEGCICCSLGLDFTYSILTIANSINPDYLIIEPSGVAWPSKIIRQLEKITYEQIQFAPPITIVDGKHYRESRQKFPDYFKDQLSVAGTIVVSKAESFSDEDFTALKADLNLSEDILFPAQAYQNWHEDIWHEVLSREVSVDSKSDDKQVFLSFRSIENQKKNDLENIGLQQIHLPSVEQLAHTLLLLTSGICGKVARVKGYCEINNQWIKFDMVDKEYAITGCEPMQNQGAVVIGLNLNRQLIQDLFFASK
ncbi:GTP-binding protein [Pasteurellaceae bacterium 22721_9_1]